MNGSSMGGIRSRRALWLALAASGAIACSSSTETSGPPILHMYISSSPAGPWTLQTVPVNGAQAVSLVDPAPLIMPDGTFLMYYQMNNQPLGKGDPALGQPNNQWLVGVGQSTDNGLSFTHKGVVFTGFSSTGDPYPILINPAGTVRLFMSNAAGGPPAIFSLTATDNTGLHFASALDAGFRARGVIDAELHKIGSTYFMYTTGGIYFTSSDGLNFGPEGGIRMTGPSDLSVIDVGNGTYVAAYTCAQLLVCTASSPDGVNWTQTSQVGFGSVPSLVRTADGIYRIYTPGP